jgi:murein DD-endopeptidase MepM/ murein hydrolase activator NlpD
MSNRIRCLSRVALIGIVGGLAGCSSDFTRMDRTLYSALPQANEAPQQGYQAAQAQNPYPGDVDSTTTASIGSHKGVPVPLAGVGPRIAQNDDGNFYGQQNAGYAQPQYSQLPAANQPAYQPYPQALPSAVQSRSLPSPAATPLAQAEARYPTDNMTTASIPSAPDGRPASSLPAPVAVPAAAVATAASGAGWTSAGGTAINLREGETLYNLSKRYGVPVSELMRANGLTSAQNLQAGQRIVIPTYVYSRSAPVSAPDNDSMTRSASSGRGALAPVPEMRPQQTASLGRQQASDASHGKTAPDYTAVTGSVSKAATGGYTVSSGDTLSGIASRHGVTVDALKQANGLASSTIRIGQTLVIPAAGTVVAAATPANVDPITTGTVAKTASVQPKPYVKPAVDNSKPDTSAVTGSVDAKAPAATGIENLRWPVQGRVVAGFGEKRASGINDGIDISVPEGTAVKAAENGVVIYSGNELEGFGNLILIRHADGIVTAYAHNSSNAVRKGQEVKRGEVIAKSGRTGNVDQPMLHFEVRKNSKPVNPMSFLRS